MKLIKHISMLLLCMILASCVQETHIKTITFKVDMRAIENIGNVGVRGNFTSNPWNETALLTDDNNDSIYEGTFSQKTAANTIQFKFVNQNTDYELGDSDNRKIDFEYKPETITYEAIFNSPQAKLIKH